MKNSLNSLSWFWRLVLTCQSWLDLAAPKDPGSRLTLERAKHLAVLANACVS